MQTGLFFGCGGPTTSSDTPAGPIPGLPSSPIDEDDGEDGPTVLPTNQPPAVSLDCPAEAVLVAQPVTLGAALVDVDGTVSAPLVWGESPSGAAVLESSGFTILPEAKVGTPVTGEIGLLPDEVGMWTVNISTSDDQSLSGAAHCRLRVVSELGVPGVPGDDVDGPGTIPGDDVPVDDPPGDDPPGDNPPGDGPPGDDPPGDDPPGDDPPGDDPPGDDPPGDLPDGSPEVRLVPLDYPNGIPLSLSGRERGEWVLNDVNSTAATALGPTAPFWVGNLSSFADVSSVADADDPGQAYGLRYTAQLVAPEGAVSATVAVAGQAVAVVSIDGQPTVAADSEYATDFTGFTLLPSSTDIVVTDGVFDLELVIGTATGDAWWDLSVEFWDGSTALGPGTMVAP